MNDQILVSVICFTYNHGAFVRKALEGFVNQKTDFKYEIIVHDDASTDNTAEIIKEYASKYDNIVPVLEETNQFNNGDYSKQKVCKLIRGKYFALCEGDDYWIDNNKLQSQISFLEKHPDYSGSFHDAIIVGYNGRTLRNGFFPSSFFKTPQWKDKDSSYDFPEMLGFDFIPTASIVGKSCDYISFKNFCENPVCSDIPLKMYLSLHGKMLYINKKMSAYRTLNPNSVSGQMRNNGEKTINTFKGHKEIYKGFDRFTGYRYHELLKKDIERRRIWCLMSIQDIKKLLIPQNFKSMRKYITFSARAKFWIKVIARPLYDFLLQRRNRKYTEECK